MGTTTTKTNLLSTLQAKDISPKQRASDDNLQARLISTHHTLALNAPSLVTFFYMYGNEPQSSLTWIRDLRATSEEQHLHWEIILK